MVLKVRLLAGWRAKQRDLVFVKIQHPFPVHHGQFTGEGAALHAEIVGQSMPVERRKRLYRAGRRQCAAGFDGIIELAPMYENTQTVIDLCGRDSHIPLLSLRLEESGEMAADERVKSFLYYL